MKSCVPKGHQVAVTTKALLYLCGMDDHQFFAISSMFDKIWVHWPSVVNALKDEYLAQSKIASTIANLWDGGCILGLRPDMSELLAISALNNTPGYEDNVSVYCATFGEYVELRKTFGAEDVTYFRRT